MDPIKQMYSWLDDFLTNQWHEYSPPAPDRFRASEAGDCARKIAYRLMGYKPDKPRTSFVELICRDGDLLHDSVRYWLRKAGVELYDLDFGDDGVITETNSRCVSITHNGVDFKIAFRADGGLMIDGDRYALEIKTIDGFSHNYMEQAYKRGGWPRLMEYLKESKRGADGKPNSGDKYRKFFAQATVTGMLSVPKPVGTYIVIKNRSLGQMGFDEANDGLAVPLDEELFTQILNRFASIITDVRAGVLPMREYTQDTKPCQVCDFRQRCWGKEGKK